MSSNPKLRYTNQIKSFTAFIVQSIIVSGGGKYIYIEASYPRRENQTSKLLSPFMRGPACFRFYYHMYGSDIRSLDVSLQTLEATTNEAVTLWTMKGQRGNRWREASINIGYTGDEFQVA